MQIVGRTITEVKAMSQEELDDEGWLVCGPHPVVIVLDSGDKLYCSQDEEGNGPGVLFGWEKHTNQCIIIFAEAINNGE